MMRVFFLHLTLMMVYATTFSQTSVSLSASTKNSTENGRLELNNYIWSHTHYKVKETDKPVIDFDAIENWQGIGEDVAITPDGKYFAYNIINGISFSKYLQKRDSLVIQSTSNSWKKTLQLSPKSKPGAFSTDSKQYFLLDNEVLYSVHLGKDEVTRIQGVLSFKKSDINQMEYLAYQLKDKEENLVIKNVSTGKEKRFSDVSNYAFDNSGNWLACQINNSSKDLLIFNLTTGDEKSYPAVSSYLFNDKGAAVLIKTIGDGNEKSAASLQVIDPGTGQQKTIWISEKKSDRINNMSFDESGNQVVFVVENAAESKKRSNDFSIWYYKAGMAKAVEKVNNQSNMSKGFSILPTASFTDDGQYIQFELKPGFTTLQKLPNASQLDIWSYKDSLFQSSQSYLATKDASYSSVINVDNDEGIKLESEYEDLIKLKGDYALISKPGEKLFGDRFWEEGIKSDSTWLLSLIDGSRLLLPSKDDKYDYWFSPDGKYLVFFDSKKGCHYFSYDLDSKKMSKISEGLPDGLLGDNDPYMRTTDKPNRAVGIAAWLTGDDGVLVYDNYDIWKLDLSGQKRPVNITNGYGRTNAIYFTMLNKSRFSFTGEVIVSTKEKVYLTGFNEKTKYNGFFEISFSQKENPRLLYMGPAFFWVQSSFSFSSYGGMVDGIRPIKASNSNTWIVQKQTATEPPNLFVTKDFKQFNPLTNLQSNKPYNQVKSELVSFKQLDGTTSQGVLYMPENFDPAKKYPVIITFYLTESNRLYQYPYPSYIHCPDISNDPTWMASHGYLVFLPDIYFTKGEWGPSTVNTIDGAARHFKSLPYVDSNHIGACGHSNSGRLGYYLLTHSRQFAAISLGSGYTGTNVIGLGLSLMTNGKGSNLKGAEITAGRRGFGLENLWENKEKWIDHTAVIQADKATSPLLLFHNKKDGDDWMAAVQLYTAFWRLEKPIWWLQYDEGVHTVTNLRDFKDFTTRTTQFYDHYLKCAPAPRWMTQGVPYKLKGIETRYDLDPNGSCGSISKPCSICKAWNNQYTRNPSMFLKPIIEWNLDKDLQSELDRQIKEHNSRK